MLATCFSPLLSACAHLPLALLAINPLSEDSLHYNTATCKRS